MTGDPSSRPDASAASLTGEGAALPAAGAEPRAFKGLQAGQRGEPVIEVQGLCHAYGRGTLKKQILFDLSIEIYPGEIVLLTGPSGSGKTTLLTLLGALRSAQEGSLRIFGEEMRGAGERQMLAVRRYIGYIFQAHNLLGFLTARQNVRMSLELHRDRGNPDELAAEMLREVGLGERIDYYPEHLSGGQKQRGAIARALDLREWELDADYLEKA